MTALTDNKYRGVEIIHSRGCRHYPGNRKLYDCDCTIQVGYSEPGSASKKVRVTRNENGVPFRNLSEALNFLEDQRSKKRNGKLPTPSNSTVEDECRAQLDRYDKGTALTRAGKQPKPGTVRAYKRAILDPDHGIIALLGHVKVSQLHRRHVQQLLVDRLIEKGLSGSSIKTTINALRAVLQHPLDADQLVADPTSRLRIPNDGKPRERTASVGEMEQLLDALPKQLRAIYAVAAYAGLRSGEIRGLRWQDIDLDENLIRVCRGWDDYHGAITPKSKKGTRTTPIFAPLRLLLLEHKMACKWANDPDGLVFGSSAIAPFPTTSVHEQAKAAWAKTNLERKELGQPLLVPIGLHESRHTAVSLMHAAGIPLERIGDYVGHSSKTMTDLYRHLVEGQHQEDGDLLHAYFLQKLNA